MAGKTSRFTFSKFHLKCIALPTSGAEKQQSDLFHTLVPGLGASSFGQSGRKTGICIPEIASACRTGACAVAKVCLVLSGESRPRWKKAGKTIR